MRQARQAQANVRGPTGYGGNFVLKAVHEIISLITVFRQVRIQRDRLLLQLDTPPQHTVNQQRHVVQRRVIFQTRQVALVVGREGLRPVGVYI